MPQRRFNYRSSNVPILDLHIQAQGRPVAELTGTLVSGATDTVLSIEAAEELGLTLQDLRPIQDVHIANNSEVPAWITDIPIRAQAQAHIPDGALEPWGPVFNLHPIFLQTGGPLWGQEDFAASFEIAFQRYLNPASFVLQYWDGMSDGAARP
jgi:hypothetical protein